MDDQKLKINLKDRKKSARKKNKRYKNKNSYKNKKSTGSTQEVPHGRSSKKIIQKRNVEENFPETESL